MLEAQVKLIDSATIAHLQRVGEQLQNTRPLLVAVGHRANVELRAWFIGKNSVGNKLGGRRTNFWWRLAQSVSGPTLLGSGRARVAVTDFRFRQKVYGGRITPKRAKALTIPVAPEAYGRTVSVFEQSTGIKLFLLRNKGGTLTNMLAGQIGSSKEIKVFYVLEKSVDQAKDPTALPPAAQFNAALRDEADKTLARATKA